MDNQPDTIISQLILYNLNPIIPYLPSPKYANMYGIVISGLEKKTNIVNMYGNKGRDSQKAQLILIIITLIIQESISQEERIHINNITYALYPNNSTCLWLELLGILHNNYLMDRCKIETRNTNHYTINLNKTKAVGSA